MGQRKTDAWKRGRVQHLIGVAISAYLNDVGVVRAAPVLDALREAFDLMVDLRRNDNPRTAKENRDG